MPSYDPLTGKVTESQTTQLPNPYQLPPFEMPQYPQVNLPEPPPSAAQRITQMNPISQFAAALAGGGAGLQGKPDPVMEQLQRQQQIEMEPYRLQVTSTQQRAADQYQAAVRAAAERYGAAARMGQTQIEQEGANRRNVQSIQGQKDVAQLQAENQERLAKLRIEAEKSLAAFNLAGQAAASGDPIAQGGMYNFMLGNKEFFKDLVVPGDAAETVERGTKLANAKIDLVKNQAKHAEVEAKLKEPLAKIHEKIAKGGKLTEDEKIVAGLKKPMTALESLQFSEVAKLTKDPKMASAYTAALMTHGNPLGMLAYSMLAQGKPLDEVTAIFKGVDKDSLDDIMTLGKIMLSDPTGQAAKDPVFQATMQFTLKKLLTKLGAKDPEIQNILKAGDSDMKKLNEIFRKALEEKYGLGEGQVGVAH